MTAALIAEQSCADLAGERSGATRDDYRAHEAERRKQFKMKRRAITCLQRKPRTREEMS